jgi:predicted peptidase
MQAHALQALANVVAELNGDEERQYLTGISMGGYGTWDMAARQSGQFAALVPICGGVRRTFGTQSTKAIQDHMRKVGPTPVWVFHGGADTVVPVTESRQAVAALEAVGGDVRYTEYPGVGHDSWNLAYAEPELMPWLLSKRR